MYDTAFDHEQSRLRPSDRRILWLLRLVAVAATILAASVDAQMPSAPILQNGWAAPGVIGALNIAGGSNGTIYAAAGSWGSESGHIQLSGAIGYETPTGFEDAAAYGGRVTVPFAGFNGPVGLAAFFGAGGGAGGRKTTIFVNPPGAAVIADSARSTGQVVAGLGIGWRRTYGSARGLSLYATPSYLYCAGGTDPGGLFRLGLGVDVGASKTFGLTAGLDFGGTRERAIGGPTGVLYGVAVSYAFGRR